MKLSSSAFRDGEDIPKRFTCEGENLSPPLAWTGAPAATRSFAVLCDDPDAPRGTWRHWAVYDLPADCAALAEGAGNRGRRRELAQGVNDFGEDGYGGPCPPHGHGTHHYHFRVLALSTASLNLRAEATCHEVEQALNGNILAHATLVGLYRR
ncbi:YbhB/YbcL family Raf kinase inhibitor-like protein [Rhodoblastus sp.]|jgi:Raf kinase inhibitor-like YbhB/YbcL family protein|uniref:YbhB/YbcL family Raf kinase inhibitor-like protein n=1 Tax=Rhodoblastus sp. TaxID=1962975 RepID=UPI002617A196|nr:YbhB/YbcL family Raf kinase inhibitor-like protein [Rhodoblastus sp.]